MVFVVLWEFDLCTPLLFHCFRNQWLFASCRFFSAIIILCIYQRFCLRFHTFKVGERKNFFCLEFNVCDIWFLDHPLFIETLSKYIDRYKDTIYYKILIIGRYRSILMTAHNGTSFKTEPFEITRNSQQDP